MQVDTKCAKRPTRNCIISDIAAMPRAFDMTKDRRTLGGLGLRKGAVCLSGRGISVSKGDGSIRGGMGLSRLLPSNLGLASKSDASL